MKKTQIVLMVLFVGAISLLAGCATSSVIGDELIIQPDSNNPIIGTWLNGSQNFMFVIEDPTLATLYSAVRIYGVPTWKKSNVYAIDNKWKVSEDGNTLTYIDVVYSRFQK
jgi:predicted small secreted protein